MVNYAFMKISPKESPKYVVAALALVWAICFLSYNVYRHGDGRYFFWLFDDALISMRYAWHWANGHGLVWNVGERTEGYTNFLLVVLMTPLHWFLPLNLAPLGVQLMNLACGAAVAIQLTGLIRDFCRKNGTPLELEEKIKLVALVWLLSYYPFLYWTLLGMEPPLITLFMLLIVRNLLSKPMETRAWRDDLWLAALQILAVLCRPDSIAFTVPLWIGTLLLIGRRIVWPRAAVVMALLVSSVALHTLFRKFYYGDWLPNTFYLKTTGLSFSDRFTNGFLFLRPFFAQAVPLALLAIAAVVKGPGRIFASLGLGLLGISLAYQIWIGGDSFVGMWRFMVPAMPLLFAGAAFIVTKYIGERASPAAKNPALVVVVIATAVWLNAAFLPWLALRDTPGRKITYQFLNIAIALEEVLKPGASIGVFSAGVLPYYLPQIRAIDFLGKSDPTIAKSQPHLYPTKGLLTLPGHNKYDLRYSILQLKPTFVEHVRWFDDDVTEPAKALYGYHRYHGLGLILLRESPHVEMSRLQATTP